MNFATEFSNITAYGMDHSKDRFYTEYESHVFSVDPIKTNSQQRLCTKIYSSGAYLLWTHLRANIVRSNWKDTSGFPLKRKYYDRHRLVCSISIRRLVNLTGFGNQKIQKLIKQLKDAGWIETDNQYTKKGQTVFILGRWFMRPVRNSKKVYGELLYEREVKDGIRLAPVLKAKNKKVEGVTDLSELTDAQFLKAMSKLYGAEALAGALNS